MTTSPIPPARVGGWLLALSPLAFVLVVLVNVWAFAAADIGAFVDITPAQMARIRPAWITSVTMVFLAGAIGVVGTMLVARALVPTRARRLAIVTIVLAVSVLIAGIADTVIRIAASWSVEPRLGDNGLYALSDGVLSRTIFAATVLLIVLLATTMHVSGRHRAAGLVVGAIAVVAFLISIAAYDYTPPFVVAMLWCPLGIAWLRGARRRGLA